MKIQNPKILHFTFSFCILIFAFFIFNEARAAVLYLEPAESEYHRGDTFIVNARIDTQGECVNAVRGDMSFDKEVLEAVDFSQGSSILTLWVLSPSIEQEKGLISFSGGIPAGFCGRVAGDPEASDLIGRVVFKIKDAAEPSAGAASAKFLKTSQVLLNDGLGTPADLIVKGTVFTILPGFTEAPVKAWQEELLRDKTPPELFEIKISKNSAVFDGKYFITFSAADKQTGIDRYEVSEIRIGKTENKEWKSAESPYLLEDQTLRSRILVKAVDKAGNERIAEYLPAAEEEPAEQFPWIEAVLLLLAGVIIIYLLLGKLSII